MQVTTANDVKVYNLSAGKTLPEWISERKRRTLLKNDIDLRRRIELIQDFSMPTASTALHVTQDRQYILAAGVYKPRLRCYDVNQLSMKFERCVDSEIVNFSILSEDYSKFVLLLADRHVELHAQYGFYYRTRVPKFGRDLAYHYPSCDLFVVGASSDIYRLNLEQGRYMTPLTTKSSACNVCTINSEHQLLTVGTQQGHVECWDPRSNTCAGQLVVQCSPSSSSAHRLEPAATAVTAVNYKNALTLAVGTDAGQVLLYDLRSPHPFLIKEHYYSLPVHSIAFQNSQDLVLSTDSKALRIWNSNNGSPFTTIEPDCRINSTCHITNSGMVLMACEDTKILSYYVPALGPAPHWCSFLDSLTEELEEEEETTVYHDYKFVTASELDQLGLSNLVGTNILRAYMHGYFMDIQLYHKAKAIAQPFAFDEYRKQRIKQKIEEKRANRVKEKALPAVNRELAGRLLESSKTAKIRTEISSNPLGDSRFSALFSNPDFQIDEESEEFQLVHPVLAKAKKKQLEKEHKSKEKEEEEEEEHSSSSEEEGVWREQRLIKHKRKEDDLTHVTSMTSDASEERVKMVAVPSRAAAAPIAMETRSGSGQKVSLGKRLEVDGVTTHTTDHLSLLGNKEMRVRFKKSEDKALKCQLHKHRAERRQVGRSARAILPNTQKLPVFWKGRRIK